MVAFDDDHVALAVVVGRVRQGSETRVQLALAPGDIDGPPKFCVSAVQRPFPGYAEDQMS